MRTWVAGGYLRRGHRGCGSAPNSELREIGGPWRTALALDHSPTTLGTMAAVAAASAELLIIGWYIFRVLLQVFLECCIYWVGFAFRNPPGTQPIARSVQVLPAEAGIHGVEDRAAGAGRAPAASPQLRPQPPALGGLVTRCSCASRPAWEPVPRRNGGSPVLSRQRSICQGQ
ncbi:neuronatin isoform X3 [Lutra lutra]|uniref:Neuronatin n=2 Tax=Lutrinae TaxID=169417 RepID=A0A2Y9ILW3_ENHLU|nr:neuronatin isoform X1 [Enhydra lutris kenyoni]XP_047600563.1 neuronatin isoform X3 [Lutra lutra]